MRTTLLFACALFQADAFSTVLTREEKIHAAGAALVTRQLAYLTNADVPGLLTQFRTGSMMTSFRVHEGSYTEYDVTTFYRDYILPIIAPNPGTLEVSIQQFKLSTDEAHLKLEQVSFVGIDREYMVHDVLPFEYDEAEDRAYWTSLNQFIFKLEGPFVNVTQENYVFLP